jgi:hypothetical protein
VWFCTRCEWNGYKLSSCSVRLTRVPETPRRVEVFRVLVVGLHCTNSRMFSCSSAFLTCSFRWNTSTGKRTTFKQCTEHLGKHSTIRNFAHRKKPTTVFFNTCSGTTIAEAVNVQHIRHLWRRAAFFTTMLQRHHQQPQQPSEASRRFTCSRQWRSTAGGKDSIGCQSRTTVQTALSLKPFGTRHIYIYTYTHTLFSLERPILWPPRILGQPVYGWLVG